MVQKQARPMLVIAALVLVVLAAGCENLEPTPEQRQAVEQAVLAYLDDLAHAYSHMDVSYIKETATRREMDEVSTLLNQLATTGDRLQATLLHVEIQKISMFRDVNATVSTMEVWDVGRFDAYDGREKARNPNSIQHSLIQLRQIDGVWKVIGRRVQETQTGSAWGVPTPVVPPASGDE